MCVRGLTAVPFIRTRTSLRLLRKKEEAGETGVTGRPPWTPQGAVIGSTWSSDALLFKCHEVLLQIS